jgi:ubiquinone/menaquinone biosynthesis C-methylase UbiE
MSAAGSIHQDIAQFYAQTSEEARLQLGLGPLEFERNKELIGRYLPQRQGIILDVGGGPGIYAEWLANQGHQVHLIDPVQKHVRQAEKRAAKLKNRYNSSLGEARKLSFKNNDADVVILHGPLYHLQNKTDRLAALTEALRVLKPGGVVLGFAIGRAASTLPGLLNGMMQVPGFLEMCKTELTTGEHHAPAALPGILPHAYYHYPDELAEEVAAVGLQFEQIYAVEGMIWMDSKYFETRADAAKKQAIMGLLQATETNRQLMVFSPHMMAVARKA